MKKRYTLLFLSLALLTLSACNRNNSKDDTKTKEPTVSTSTQKKSDKKKESTTKSSETSQSSSSQTEPPAQNNQQVQTPETTTPAPDQTQTPVVEQPNQEAATTNQQAQTTNNWMSPELKANYIEAGKFDPNFIENLSQTDYQIAVDRAQQRLEETGFGDVSNIWYELYKMYPESTTLFEEPPYDTHSYVE